MSISGRLRDHASAVCVHVLVRAAAAAAACIPPSSWTISIIYQSIYPPGQASAGRKINELVLCLIQINTDQIYNESYFI